MPDFNVPNPHNNFVVFNTPEEWLDSELHKLALENHYFEIEYYASKPLMTEEEYSSTKFSQSYIRYAPDYFEYIKRWKEDHKKIVQIEINRNLINQLLDKEFVDRRALKELNLSSEAITIINAPSNINPMDYLKASDFERTYFAYSQIWEKSRTKVGKQNVLYSLERRWFFDFHGDFNYDSVKEKRQLIKELKLDYVQRWNQLLEKQKSSLQEWEEKRKKHQINQENRKKEVENIRIGYHRLNPDSIIAFFGEVIKCSDYNFDFEKNIEIDFNPETKLLMAEYSLPTIENLPNIKETKYYSSKREYKDVLISNAELLKLFDEAVYGITLRSIYEIFTNDTINSINAINFNGWIKSINKATGKKENNCIVSIQVQRNAFMDIDLLGVDSKTCFKFFKGVGSSKLYGITAIQPILQIQKTDKRFVNNQNIEFDNLTNLALMDWEDFEHLIRELFEKEFRSNGGEVKVTQASRDGGVDAVAFDPDPIRGGKIVIQAKRYTNTVGVSAVRDLFGTVMNEGANKGILVTTSDYGSDSYEFAKGKPLTLLNGANLLYLLEKHGTRAKIDIKEARRIMEENK
ncbi:MAG TPA: hypothetical protein DCG75_17980 [Bacteroidales bacterium]|nr:hypothetical protein [Bacteroidales bacterium]